MVNLLPLGMTYKIIQAPKDLQNFVSHFWVASYNHHEPTGFTYYSTANTLTEIAFAFKVSDNRHNELLFSSVQGHTSHAAQISTENFVDIMGASIYSYAVPLLLHVSPSDIINQFIDFYTLQGTKAKGIMEAMENAASIPDRIQVLVGYFRSQLAQEGKGKIHHQNLINTIRYIRKNNGIVNISQLASDCFLTKKTFERRFTAFSGFTPKQYAMIVRFESAFLNCRRFNTLTEAAYTYGYFDQAHFIRDFKSFAGYSPQRFFSLVHY
jgi:AraC-like DNA-binding protein